MIKMKTSLCFYRFFFILYSRIHFISSFICNSNFLCGFRSFCILCTYTNNHQFIINVFDLNINWLCARNLWNYNKPNAIPFYLEREIDQCLAANKKMHLPKANIIGLMCHWMFVVWCECLRNRHVDTSTRK